MNQKKVRMRLIYKTGLMIAGILLSVQLFAQQRTITGVVMNEKGETLPGVNILVKGTGIGDATGIDGKFSI